jgi:hypothetical protein
MSALRLPLTQSYHPVTFLERGVAVPFTTPMLMGARARPAERGGPELVVPSPSGSRGVYVLAWNGVRELCQPTVHDRRLNEVVAALSSVTPSAIRKAARDVAAEGLAGREAIAAAGVARDAEHREAMVANFMLLMALVQQMEPGEAHAVSPVRGVDSALETRAKRVIARIAPRLGRDPDAIAASLEEMAPLFASTGMEGSPVEGRAARALGVLSRVRAETAEWSQSRTDESAALAGMVATVADLTISCTEATLAEAHTLTADMTRLLRRWTTEPARIRELAARPEWLLDGWEQVCLLWLTATEDAARRAALPEMALLVPIVPREAGDWLGGTVNMDAALRVRRTVSLNEDWRTGTAVFELIARNEHLRALAA